MAVPNGYVGYTVDELPTFRTCVGEFRSRAHTPSIRRVVQIARARRYFGGFSLFQFIVRLNNLNGAQAVPPGNVIVARISEGVSRVDCGDPPFAFRRSYYEKFKIPAIDVQLQITACRSLAWVDRTVQYAIMPDPVPQIPVPAAENAVSFLMPEAQKAVFLDAITLQIRFVWGYDGCRGPPRTPKGPTHEVQFTAMTIDPAAGPGKISSLLPGSPLIYKSPIEGG